MTLINFSSFLLHCWVPRQNVPLQNLFGIQVFPVHFTDIFQVNFTLMQSFALLYHRPEQNYYAFDTIVGVSYLLTLAPAFLVHQWLNWWLGVSRHV